MYHNKVIAILVDNSYGPEWRNGRRSGFKILCIFRCRLERNELSILFNLGDQMPENV
jgi:hypothetical protein